MRLKNFLNEDGLAGGSAGVGAGGAPGGGMIGGNTSDQTGGATTTKNVEKYWNKVLSAPVRRENQPKKKKKKKKPDDYIVDDINDNIFEDMATIIEFGMVSEMAVPDPVYQNIKKVGKKIGFKIKRSDTMFDYLARAEREIVDVFNLLCWYILATDKKQKEELKDEIKKALLQINRKRLIAFFVQMDKFTFGIMALVRRVVQNIFGIEITSYNTYVQDIEYIVDHLAKIKKVLWKLNPTPEEINAFNQLNDIILRTKMDIESSKIKSGIGKKL